MGHHEGGLKTAEKLLARDPNHYRRIGAEGGHNGRTGGFAACVECNCELRPGTHYVANCAGIKGGTISRRGPAKKAYNEKATCSETNHSPASASTSKVPTSKCSDCKRSVPTNSLDDMGLCPDCPQRKKRRISDLWILKGF